MSSDGGLPGRGMRMEAGRAETTGSVSVWHGALWPRLHLQKSPLLKAFWECQAQFPLKTGHPSPFGTGGQIVGLSISPLGTEVGGSKRNPHD